MYPVTALIVGVFLSVSVARAQIDQLRADRYFAEAADLCERESGRLWGVSLCGPMVFADAATRSIATNQAAPTATRPPMLGVVNAPVEWGGTRWSAYVWSMIPADDAQARGRLIVHELFHRVQPQLGLIVGGKPNDHLDTLEGRYWLQLEWRALARALGAAGSERTDAVRDALAFRAARRDLFAGAADSERGDEIREGLAQYTGTVVAAASQSAANADAIAQLATFEKTPTFVRTFAYPSGAAYGLLLDIWSPGWTRRLKPADDLGQLLMESAQVRPAPDALGAARRYGAPELRVTEEKRELDRAARIVELRRRFVEGPVLTVPRGRGAMVSTLGATPIPNAGTVFFEYRLTAEWGALESKGILESSDGQTLRLPAPFQSDRATLTGDGWTITLAPGWVVRPGPRPGDFHIVRETTRTSRRREAPCPSHAPSC
jgi:hypothetical protein